MERAELEKIIQKVIQDQYTLIPIEASGRHVHLCQEHIEALFGEGYELKNKRELSQPGQYQCEERVRLIGPRGVINNVTILGPKRPGTQVEVSLTDALTLGIKPPINESGDLTGANDIYISHKDKIVKLKQGVIAAKRHIHMTPEDAQRMGVTDKQIVSVTVNSKRPLVLQDVTVRVNPNFRLNMHIDYDEANACAYEKGVTGTLNV